MKVLLLITSFFCLSNTLRAQTCTGGAAATPVSLAMTGRKSNHVLGNIRNEIGTLNAAITGDVVGIQVSGVQLTTVSPSWCEEATILFENPTTGAGITFAPSTQGSGSPCNDLPINAFYDLAALSLVFPTGASGAIGWELYETVNDVTGNPGTDANYTAGSITLYVCPTGQVLPIELISFSASAKSSSNSIFWTTASEVNIGWHIIERSNDGISNWSEVGKVAGESDSKQERFYSLDDNSPFLKSYYRLRSVDTDGQEQISQVIALTRTDGRFGILSAFPNPATESITVEFNTVEEGTVTARITDVTSRLVAQQQMGAEKGINLLPIQLDQLSAGTYFITLQNGSNITEPMRFVKQ